MSFSKFLQQVLLFVSLVAIVYLISTKYSKRNTIRIELTSKSSSKINIRNENSRKYEEVQHIIEQTEKLSLDLTNEFNQDLQKLRHHTQRRKISHQDYIYHTKRYSGLEKTICKKPYQLLILCLDETNVATRTLYRKTWAAKRESIVSSDGIMPIEWKVIFAVDVASTTHAQTDFEEEQQKYKDVIGFTGSKGPRKDIFKLMSALDWVNENCDYSFLVKMKNGTFLNTPKMFSFLRDPRVPATELYGGIVIYEKNSTAIFYTNDKRLMKGYPRFINDAFIMSFDVVDKIIRKFHWLKPHTESDVYIGELVLQSGIDVWPIPNLLYKDTGNCAEYNLDGILIECRDQCVQKFNDQALKIIPEL